MEKNIFAEVEAQAERLGMPRDFYRNLLNEDDWSFVIKANALVEAASSDALAARFHAPELAISLATLDLGHKKHGKVALLRALGAITKEQSTFLQVLYELRNRLAHNIKQVSFTFESYLDEIEPKDKASFIKHVGHGIQPNVPGMPRETFVTLNPKLALWLTLSEVLACIHLEHDVAKANLTELALGIWSMGKAATDPNNLFKPTPLCGPA